MRLIKSGRIVEDAYVNVPDDGPLPDGVPVIVSATRFLADAEAILDRAAPVGVAWPNNRRIGELAPYVDRLATIVLTFPIFRDGRAYSQARILRERYRFTGELRAAGQILRDQFGFLVRAGFDVLEVVKDSDAEAFAAVLGRYTVFYQVARDSQIAARRRVSRLPAPVAGEAVH